MKLYFWKSPSGNIGDDLNAWLWPKVFGEDFFDNDPKTCFIGIGSVLEKNRHYFDGADRKIVFGAGLRNRSSFTGPMDNSFKFHFVRGPRSARLLTRYGATYISDPAILTPLYLKPMPKKDYKSVSGTRIGFVPYYNTNETVANNLCNATGMLLISPKLPVEEFVSNIVLCDYILSEAMHGAIFADAYRIPWMGCRIQSALLEGRTSLFKWADWMDSLGIQNYVFTSIPKMLLYLPRKGREYAMEYFTRIATDQVGELLKSDRWGLSDRKLLNVAQERILAKANALKKTTRH